MEEKLNKTLPIITFKQAVIKEIDYIKGRKSGKYKSLKTSSKKLNDAGTDGIEWGSIITIAGMSGVGKTTLLNQIETDIATMNDDQDLDILNFSLEMVSRRLIGRKISRLLQKPTKSIYSAGEESEKITDNQIDISLRYMQEVHKNSQPIFYVEESGTIDQILNTIITHYNKRKRPLVVTLDHTLLIRLSKDERDLTAMLYKFGGKINDLKKKIPLVVIMLSQLNRNIEKEDRRDPRKPHAHYPVKADVSGSDATYQLSDIFIIVHAPERLGIVKYGPKGAPTQNKVFLHYIKIREGRPFIAMMENDLKNNRLIEPQTPNN